jgi:hypothetical protein
MNDFPIVVLAADSFRHNQSLVGDLESPLLIPVHGKPAFMEILKSFPRNQVYFLISERAGMLLDLLKSMHHLHSNFEIISVPETSFDTPTKTLCFFIEMNPDIEGAFVLYGDMDVSSIEILDENSENVIFVGEFIESPRYSYLRRDHSGKYKYAKTFREIGQSENEILTNIGCYKISNLPSFRSSAEGNFANSIAELLLDIKTIEIRRIDGWSDMGHFDPRNNKSLPPSRAHNQISLNVGTGVIRKSSSDEKKLQAEYQFLKSIPVQFTFYFPRVGNYTSEYYEIEYWPLRNLSEYAVFWKLPLEVWKNFIEKFFSTLMEFRAFALDNSLTVCDSESAQSIIRSNFLHRFDQYPSALLDLVNSDEIQINGIRYHPRTLIANVINHIQKPATEHDVVPGLMHGDLCLSNILFDPYSGSFKLIDPRGSDSGRGLIGDLKYDLSKMLHSIQGKYDFIIAGLYSIEKFDKTFNFEVFFDKSFLEVSNIFMETLSDTFPELSLPELNFYQGMLFLNMIPLHSEDPKRQMALFFTGLQILSEGTFIV